MSDYARDEPSKKVSRKGRYIGTRYPSWDCNGRECRIVREQGPGLWVSFKDVAGEFLVHRNDVEEG